MERYTASELSRFNSKWQEWKGCKLWQSPLDKDGYGTFFFRKLGRRAHRVAYYMFVGDIPDGMVIDHVCGVRNCVSPDHLRLLTVRENSLDSRGVGAINARKTHCKFGHAFDKKYGNQRYCSICEKNKTKRLLKKWRTEDVVKC